MPFLFRADRLLLVIAVGAGAPELGSPLVQSVGSKYDETAERELFLLSYDVVPMWLTFWWPLKY